MIITKRGITIRSRVDQIRVMGRAAQGVRVINLSKGGEIAAVAKVPKEDEIEDVEGIEIDSEDIDDDSPDTSEENGTENDTTEE